MLLHVEANLRNLRDELSVLDGLDGQFVREQKQLSDSVRERRAAFRSLVKTMETKLRAFLTEVDLYTDSVEESGTTALVMNVSEVTGGTVLMLEFYKPVTDDFGNRSVAATWKGEWFISDDYSDPSNLARTLDLQTAGFAAKYWLVNDDKCP